jgi:cytochrome c553
VARGELRDDDHRYSGRIGRELAPSYPFPITAEVLQRGRERYTIYCTPCHGQLGNGEGMVVQRGFKRPTSFHIERLRHAAPGYYFDVMTNGFGAMSDYTAQVPVDDRWAIAAYIRALQISQNTSLADVPEDRRGELQGSVGGAAAAQRAPAPAEKAH